MKRTNGLGPASFSFACWLPPGSSLSLPVAEVAVAEVMARELAAVQVVAVRFLQSRRILARETS
jgi:hypothetical protein